MRWLWVIAGVLIGGFVGPQTTDQSEVAPALALFYGTVGGLVGWITAWSISKLRAAHRRRSRL